MTLIKHVASNLTFSAISTVTHKASTGGYECMAWFDLKKTNCFQLQWRISAHGAFLLQDRMKSEGKRPIRCGAFFRPNPASPQERLLRCSAVWASVALSCLILCSPTNCGLPGFSVPGVFQARTREWTVPTPGPFWMQRRNWNLWSCTGRWSLHHECHLEGPTHR